MLSGVGSTPASAGSPEEVEYTGTEAEGQVVGARNSVLIASFAFLSKVGSKVLCWDENGRLAERGESLKWISSRVSRPWNSEFNTFPTLHNPPGHQSLTYCQQGTFCVESGTMSNREETRM